MLYRKKTGLLAAVNAGVIISVMLALPVVAEQSMSSNKEHGEHGEHSSHHMSHEHHSGHSMHQSTGDEPASHSEHHTVHTGHAAHADHSAHRAAIQKKYGDGKYSRSEAVYSLENLTMVNMDSRLIQLERELIIDKPVILNFIFTSCTTICPVLSASFSQFQEMLGEEARDVKMVSISIDPEYDTPERLREYAQMYSAGQQWTFYTGSLSQSENTQKAFDAYRGSKMNHIPLTFIKAPGKNAWVRIEGFSSASDLVSEYRKLLNS